MTRSCEPRRAPPRPPESPSSSWCFVGITLVTLVLQLPPSLGLCGQPPVFQSMKLKVPPQPAYLPGEKVYYQCNPGYYYSYFYGLSTYCEKNNSWYPIDEACYKKQCPTPKVPNGEVYEQYEPQTGFQFDKDAYFYCNYGYYLKGEPILTCKLSGDTVYWGGDIPTCEKILCGEPGIIENGKRTNSWRVEFEFNEVVTYTCDPSDGPQEYSLVGESKLSCSGPGEWSSGPPQCKVVQCEPPVLKYGKPLSEMKEKFFYKDEVAFECLKGFYLNGSNPVFCGGNSTWEPEMPTCIKGFKPTHPTKPPLSRYPGYPKPLESPPIEEIFEIDPGIIALIILTILVGIAVICTCVYKCLQKGTKGVRNCETFWGHPGSERLCRWLNHRECPSEERGAGVSMAGHLDTSLWQMLSDLLLQQTSRQGIVYGLIKNMN